jgi:tetratricopeptide (TPR) repeat protein
MSASSGFSSNPSNSINVKGDRNQSIDRNYAPAFGNVEGNVYLSQQPKFLSLHQLSFDIDFTGRETEIQTICKLSIDGTSVAISGMPGVGKSALAIHVAQQLAESDFPDVQLYVDLRGADGDGLDPAEVLAGFLRAFGLDESSIPRDLQERSRLYRSQLAGKRSIVLLDNAQDEAQVRPLLPGNGCALIITSRRVLGALAAQSIPLNVLSADEARDLLAKSIGMTRLEAEVRAAAEILRLCDGLPLAILIAGGTLKSKRHWSLAEYSQKLSDQRQRLERLQLSDLSVRASFELSYRELSVADGLLFGKLGILVGKDFGEELAAVVHDADSPVIDGIERLIDAQLLEANLDRRYRFHDLLRVFAREKLAESISLEQQETIKQQIVNWGCERSQVMNNLLNPVERHQIAQQWIESEKVAADFDEQGLTLYSLDWFEKEREQLLSTIDWANDAERGYVVVSLARSLADFFQTRSYWQNWGKIVLMALEATSQMGEWYLKGIFITELGNMFCFQSRWNEAIEYFQQSLTIFRELGDRQREGHSLLGLGSVYRSQGQWTGAIDCLEQSLTIFRELSDSPHEKLQQRHQEGKALNNLGNVYHSQRQWDKAIDCHQQSAIVKRELGDKRGEGLALNNLGNIYQAQNRCDEAIDCYQRSLIIQQALKDRHRESVALVNLGNVYNSQDRWNNAIDCYKQSLTIFRELGDRYGEATTLANLGLVYEQLGQLNRSIDLWQEALTKLPKGAAEYPTIRGWLEND